MNKRVKVENCIHVLLLREQNMQDSSRHTYHNETSWTQHVCCQWPVIFLSCPLLLAYIYLVILAMLCRNFEFKVQRRSPIVVQTFKKRSSTPIAGFRECEVRYTDSNGFHCWEC
jgi:hypothetical protein